MKKEQAYNFYKFIMDKGYEVPLRRKFRYGLIIIKTPEDIGITKYEFDKGGYLNVFEHVDLSDYGLTKLPFKFGFVIGYFSCSNNQLTSLEGAPREVEGAFNCSGNKLTSLKGGPREVRKKFNCSDNQLISLEWAPREVGWDFYCWDNAKKFTEEEVEAVSKVGKNIIV